MCVVGMVQNKATNYSELSYVFSDELWRYHVATNKWNQVMINSDKPKPKARGHHQLIYMQPTGELWLHGGFDGKRALNDTWVYDLKDNSWVELVSTVTDSNVAPRYGHQMIYLSTIDEMWIHGGFCTGLSDHASLFQGADFQDQHGVVLQTLPLHRTACDLTPAPTFPPTAMPTPAPTISPVVASLSSFGALFFLIISYQIGKKCHAQWAWNHAPRKITKAQPTPAVIIVPRHRTMAMNLHVGTALKRVSKLLYSTADRVPCSHLDLLYLLQFIYLIFI